MADRDAQLCLVLGGKGFIGSHLVDGLLREGYRVRVFDRPYAERLNDPRDQSRVEWHDGDFGHEADIAAALEGCDICFHLVSTTLPQSSNADPAFDVETNIAATVRMLGHAAKAGVKKIIFASSGGTVYGIPRYVPLDEAHPTEPTSSYGITKLAIEKYLALFERLHGLRYVVLRPSNPFGERQRIHASQGAIAVFLGKVLHREPVEIWGDGSVVRDYLYIGDLIAAFVAAARYDGPERIFNIGSGKGLSLNEVLDGLERATGLKAERRYLPARPFDVPANVLAIDRARAALAWAPTTPFADALDRTARWLKATLG